MSLNICNHCSAGQLDLSHNGLHSVNIRDKMRDSFTSLQRLLLAIVGAEVEAKDWLLQQQIHRIINVNMEDFDLFGERSSGYLRRVCNTEKCTKLAHFAASILHD